MKRCEIFYQFLSSSKDTQLPESDVEWGGQVWPILLLDDDSIDSTGQGSGIDLVVETFDIGKNSTHIAEVTHTQLLSGTLGYGSLLNPGIRFSAEPWDRILSQRPLTDITGRTLQNTVTEL